MPDPRRPLDVLVPVQPAAMHELVLDRIQRAIHLGVYGPGDRLPAERELAEHLRVSRVTVREAMRVLEVRGYVKSRRGIRGGWFVFLAPHSLDDLRRRARESMAALNDILDFRIAVEGAAARLAAARRTDDDIVVMREAIDVVRGNEDPVAFRRADTTFHLAIADAARNRMLRDAIEEARATMFLLPDAIGADNKNDNSVEEHSRILEAIVRRDERGAEETAIQHIESTRDQIHDDLQDPK